MRHAASTSLVGLLGETRARLVDLLRPAPASVAEIAGRLELSEPAVRRHLQVLERDGLVVAETVRRAGPGRPTTRYALSERARRLYPDHSADFANELLDFVENEHGRHALLQFLRWRQGRQAARYAAELAGLEDPAERTARLAELLSADGFLAEVSETVGPDGRPLLELHQGHCAISEVAAEHPEVCAYEAALFQRLLGGRLSRRRTIASGDGLCVCTITPPDDYSTTNAPREPTSTGVQHGHQG